MSGEGILDYAWCEDAGNETLLFYNLSTVSSTEIYVHAVILAGIIAVGLCGNAVILLLVACDKRLRYRSTYAALNIVFVDLLLTIFFHGVALTSLFVRKWPYGTDDIEICRFYAFMSPYFIYVRWIGLSLICVDRFLTVRFPFHYEKHKNIFLIVLFALVWSVPIAFGAALILVGRPTFRTNVPTCLVSCANENKPALCRSMNVLLFTITFVIGGLIPSILYTWMYRKGKRLKPKLTMGTFPVHIVASAFVAVNTTSTTIQNSNSEVNRERRTLTTLILLYLTVLLTSIPQYLLVLLRGVNICAFFKIPISIHFVVADIFFLSTALDPIVIMKNQEFRAAFRKIVLRKHVVQSMSQRSITGLTEEISSL